MFELRSRKWFWSGSDRVSKNSKTGNVFTSVWVTISPPVIAEKNEFPDADLRKFNSLY